MIQPRVRLALTAADYVVQPFEQDDLVALEPSVDAPTALATTARCGSSDCRCSSR